MTPQQPEETQVSATAQHPGADAGPTAAPEGRQLGLATIRDYGVVASFVALFVVLSFASDVFFTQTNLLNIADQWSAVLIIACGSTLVLIAGGFDLSVGSVFAISGVTAALLAPHLGPWPAIVVGVLMGTGWGLVNGIVTTIGRINPFITTLATSSIAAGFALVMTNNFLVTVDTAHFQDLGNNTLLGVKYSIWIAGLFAVACQVLLARSVFGRYIYASGGNPEAARLSGVRVNGVRCATFVISGLSAGIAGVIVASRVSSGQADAGGLNLALDAITGVVIGGTSIVGGAGAVWRSVIGVLLLALIGNGFNLLGIDSTYQRIIQGAIVLAAVGIDSWARRTQV